MSPYNAYSSTLSSSYVPSTTKYSSTGYSPSSALSCTYKPPAYSSTLTSRYKPRNTYTSSSTYTPSSYTPSAVTRQLSSTYISNRVPKFNSVSSYTSAITNSSDYKWRSSSSTPSTDVVTERLWRSPSLSRRSSSSSSSSLTTLPRTQDRSPRSSLSTYSSVIDESSPNKNSSWFLQSCEDNEDKPGIRIGLYNLGNTCFMNAVLQCLLHTQPLVDYCTKGSYISDLNPRSPSNGDLIKAFVHFIKSMVETKSKTPVSPYRLRREVQRCAPRFSGDNQQDAQEFLRCLLQGLHDDVNRVKYKSTRRDSFGGDSFSSWRRYKDSDDSLVVDLFAGQLKSTLKCTLCANASITYDPFWDLSLPMPEGSINATLRQCFSLFSSPEFLDGPDKPMCEKCKKKTRSSKQMEISKFPKILVIHLKRFSASCNGQKLNMMVDCPMNLGNVSDLASQNCFSGNSSYSLYGVVDHDGSNNSGHYTARCKNPITKEWYEFNDTRVTKTTSIISSNSYILFYTQ